MAIYEGALLLYYAPGCLMIVDVNGSAIDERLLAGVSVIARNPFSSLATASLLDRWLPSGSPALPIDPIEVGVVAHFVR